jgi:hypothetical protein
MDNIPVDVKNNKSKSPSKTKKKRSVNSKQNRPKAILDLDNTIICSEAEEDLDFDKNNCLLNWGGVILLIYWSNQICPCTK